VDNTGVHGYVRNLFGQFTSFTSAASAINDRGSIIGVTSCEIPITVGPSTVLSPRAGVFVRSAQGTVTTACPISNAVAVTVAGLNDFGSFAGYAEFDAATIQGFIFEAQ
jgi:hypothetical protein